MGATHAPAPPEPSTGDAKVVLIETWLAHQRATLDELQAIVGALAPQDHRDVPACRLGLGLHVIHDGGWWAVIGVERVEIDQVRLVLRRLGRDDLTLHVDPGDSFITAVA